MSAQGGRPGASRVRRTFRRGLLLTACVVAVLLGYYGVQAVRGDGGGASSPMSPYGQRGLGGQGRPVAQEGELGKLRTAVASRADVHLIDDEQLADVQAQAEWATVRVRTVDVLGKPLTGIGIVCWQNDRVSFAGSTEGDDAVLACSVDRDADVRISVDSAIWYAPDALLQETELIGSEGGVPAVDFSLEAAGRIVGSVEVGGDMPGLVEGLSVFALYEHRSLSPSEILQLVTRGASSAVAKTSQDGRFEIRGLRPNANYYVYVGGNGVASSTRERVLVRDGLGEAQVSLSYIYALQLYLQNPDGTPATICPQLFGPELEAYNLGDPTLGRVPSSSVPAFLAGLEWVGQSEQTGSGRVYLVEAPDARNAVGPIEIDCNWPGYQAETIRADAWPLIRGPNRVVQVLQPNSVGFGSIKLRAKNLPGQGGASGRLMPLARLELQSDAGAVHSLDVSDVLAGEVRMDGIPFGAYGVSYNSRMGVGELSAAGAGGVRVDISDAETLLEVDFAGAASIRVNVTDAQGAEYRGPLTLLVGELADEDSGELVMRSIAFKSWPYALAAVPAGALVVESSSPRSFDALSPEFVNVHPGESRLIELSLVAE